MVNQAIFAHVAVGRQAVKVEVLRVLAPGQHLPQPQKQRALPQSTQTEQQRRNKKAEQHTDRSDRVLLERGRHGDARLARALARQQLHRRLAVVGGGTDEAVAQVGQRHLGDV